MNLGIIGNGYIVNVLLDTIKGVECIIPVSMLVRESSLEKGKEIANSYNINKVYTDLEQFLEDKSIDTVYIGIINSLHYDYALKALRKGKNVICEKPFTRTKKEAEELFKVAEENGVFLFEAITTLHLPMYKIAKEHINKIGKPRLINCSFCQYSSRYDNYKKGIIAPVFNKELFGGSLVDLNIYNIHFVVSLYGVPETINYFYNISDDDNKVDLSGVLVLDYGNFKAVCVASKDSVSESYGILQGEDGYIKINSSLNNCESCLVDTKEIKEKYVPENNFGRMYYEMVEFERIIREKDYSAYNILVSETINVMSVLEEAYDSMEKSRNNNGK